MVTKGKKKMLGGSWLLLTLLMIGMSWSAAVPAANDDVSSTDVEEDTANVEDQYALSVEEIDTASFADYGYPDENELVGSRTESSKTYVTETGKAALVTTDPIHYLDDGGVWQNIDLNIETTATGWAVTENTFTTEFSADMNRGISIQVDDTVDPLLMGLNPTLVTMEGDSMAPMVYGLDETAETISTGGNVLRYPMGEGVSLDYQVTAKSVKQNLIIRDMPYFAEGFVGWFGIQEEVILPHGYSVFNGESPLRDGELMKTNGSIDIRNIETGELLVTIPAPLITDSNESGDLEPYFGQYILVQMGEFLHLTTVVDSEWLTNETRVYPVVIDPSVDVSAPNTWYARKYSFVRWGRTYTYYYTWATSSIAYSCQGTGSSYSTCGYSSYSSFNFWPIYKFNLANVVPTGATVNDPSCSNCGVKFENHVGRLYSGSGNFEVAVMKSGTSQSSTIVDPSSGSVYQKAQRAANSPSSSASTSISDPGYYYYGGSVKSITMNTNGEDDVQDAIDGNAAGSNGNMLGVIVRPTTNEPRWYWCAHSGPSYYGCSGASHRPHLELTYTGGSDATAPQATHTPFSGKTTYLTGSRTLYIELADASGINTTTAGNPHLYWKADSGSWNAVTASTIGTCAAGASCYFKATIPAQTAPATGTKTISYYWAYRDSPSPPNGGVSGTTGTTPAGGTGLPSNMNTHPTSAYSYEIEHVDNAADGDNKWMLKGNKFNSYSYSSGASGSYDWQLTYYEPSREYHIEWDTSRCNTGSNACFNGASIVDLRYYPNTVRYATSSTAQNTKVKVTVPGLTMDAKDGPNMDLIFYHDGTNFGVMGYDSENGAGIERPNSDGDIYTTLDYGSTDDGYVMVDIPGDITGYFGGFSWNSSYNLNSANRNYFCVSTNMHPLIFSRSTRTTGAYNNPCINSFSFYRYEYAWNGFMLPGYDGKVQSGWSVASKVSSIKPTPDTFPPEFDHGGLMDSYVDTDRSLTFEIKDVGDPAVGLATNASHGPSMEYRVKDGETGTWSGWTTRAFSPVGASPASCEAAVCTWTANIPGTDRGNTVEYKMEAQDLLGNTNTSTVYSYELKSPTKVFVLEWHDMTAGFNTGYNVNYQVRLYDVTNEIEFEYDTGSSAYYDYQTIGYQNPSANTGETIRTRGPGYIAGLNPFANNYRIATDGSAHSYETYAAGYSELFNYNEEYTGTNNGRPYTYYCTRYWSSYINDCSTVIDLPNDFEFDYFGSTYNGTQGHKIHAIRHGAMQFSTSSATSSAQMMSSGWGTTMPSLPSGTSFAANVDLAPWWGYYAAYYCYYNSGSQCSIRSKMIPFDGAGMDWNNDITTPTTWDHEMSPIRVNPASGDYLQVSADLTIEAGVEIQIAEGKGIVFTGACNRLVINGNASHPVKITNMGLNYAKGLAFTNGCATTDDRHIATHTNFENLDIAFSMGSRHGSAPHFNGNVGNLTLTDVSFTNVSTAISHGSGQGTGITLADVDVSNSADSCMVFPDSSTVSWVGGSATDCNTHAYAGQGAVDTGSGSTIWIENVDFTDSAVNGIYGTPGSLSLSNVTVDASGMLTQQSGTAVAQTSTANSGTSLYAFNVDMANYVAALTTHATDSIHMEQVDSTSDSNGYWITPSGASSPTIGDLGWTMEDVSADGGMTMARTMPLEMNNIDLGGELKFSGTGPSNDWLTGGSIQAQGLTVNGCGWKIDFAGVDLGDASNTADSWVSANCGSTTSSNLITVADGTLAGNNGSQNNFAYARNSILTLASMDITGQTNWGNYVAFADTNADVRLIDSSFRGNECLDSSGSADTSACWVNAEYTAKVHFGGTGEVYVYRSSTIGGVTSDTMQPGHRVTTAVHDPSSGAELFNVGTTVTDSTGLANAWLITDLFERDASGNTVSSASYTDHTFRVAGAAGQNVTTPTDAWYSGGVYDSYGSDLPLGIGETIYLSLEAYPMDFNGATKDCAFFAANDSASLLAGPNGNYHTYQRQIITLSTDMVLDGCRVHLEGTSLRMNRSAGNNPTITLLNGGELLLSEYQGDTGHIRAESTNYPWTMVIGDNGLFALDAAWISDMNGGLAVNAGTMDMINGSAARGSPNAGLGTATIDVDGGTLTMTDSSVLNANSGVGIHLESTAASVLNNIIVKDAAVGIAVHDAAVAIDGYTLTNNTVGMDVQGGMSLPTIYRSTSLSGENAGWTTHEIDITGLAGDSNFVQVGINQIYGGGNSDPRRGNYYAKYFLTTDRYRIAVDDGTGEQNITDSGVTGYYPYSAADPASGVGGVATYDGGTGGAAVWDCNIYGYVYNPGGNYQREYYYYFLAYGGGAYTSNGGNYNPPNEFGFRYEAAEHTASTNYYPYMYWASYWPSFYHAGTNFVPPEGFNGMWGSYNVCQNYAYGPLTPTPAGGRVAFPIVDTSDSSIQSVKVYVDVVHYGADYYPDRMEFVVRSANDVTTLLSKDYARDFGTSAIDNGVITGSDTGLRIGGARAAADITNLDISAPTNEGVLIDGSTGATIDNLDVDGGRYGARMTSAAGGKLTMTNVDFDGQSQDGLVLSKDMNLQVTGTLQNAGYCGMKILSASNGDWDFTGLSIDGNGIGVNHAGSGTLRLVDTTMGATNGADVDMSGTATVHFLEGTIDDAKVTASDSSKLTRLRELDVTITKSEGGAVGDDSPVKILNADNRVIASGLTSGGTGDVSGMEFVTWTVDKTGKTSENLAGYQLVTVAKVAYVSNSVADFRYALNQITLVDAPGNTASAALSLRVDAKTCYSYTTTSYNYLQNCSGLYFRNSRSVSNGDGAGGTMTEFGYYALSGTSSETTFNTALENKTILLDTPYNYLTNTKTSLNNSLILTTGTYNGQTRLYNVANYGSAPGALYMDNVTMIAMGKPSGNDDSNFRLGYSGTYSYGDYYINNSRLLGMSALGSGSGYYANDGDIEMTNNLIMHHRVAARSSSSQYDDMCIQSSGYDHIRIINNTMIDCGVGMFVPNNYYATNSYYVGSSLIGTQDLVMRDNTMEDTQNLAIWFYLNARVHDAQFIGNTVTGTPPRYAVYNQDSSSQSFVAHDNVIHADNPIYSRSAQQYTITDNTITGISDASRPCIYALNGHGVIRGNSCMDADGGIRITGVRSGNDVWIEGNSIGFSTGRVPTSAIGIYVESCGLDEVFMGNNHVSTIMNAVNTDGCKVTDNGSVYQALPGIAARTWNVDSDATTFSPAHLTNVCIGDSVRWTARAYNSGTPHTTTSDAGQAESWDSGTMNLGSSFVHTFTNAGNFTYASTSSPAVTGSVNVAACTSNLVTTGFDVMGGADDLVLNGVSILGYGTGLEMSGGSLAMNAGVSALQGGAVVPTSIQGDAVAVNTEDVDITTNGAYLVADNLYGTGLKAVSQSGNDDLELTQLSTLAAVGVLADGHEDFRWNGGNAGSWFDYTLMSGGLLGVMPNGGTVLKTINGASGTIENMSSTNGLGEAHLWGGGDPTVQGGLPGFACVYPAGTNPFDPNDCGGPSKVIDAGAYSTITSIGNGVLNNGVLGDATNNYAPGNYSKLTIHADAVIHEGNLLDLTVNHCPTGPASCGAASDVGLYMRSLTTGTFADGSVGFIPAGRAEYVSPSWRVNAGHTVAIDGNFLDWEGNNLLNMADDMQPGIVAINASTLAQMRVTWDSSFMYIALIGPTFSLTDGMMYMDTGPGGSSTGDSWHVTHTLGMEADYMLWMEDLNNWGIRKVMPTGAWVDVTNTCNGIDSYLFGGNPLLQTPVSEFRLPWDCIGSPTQEVRWTALVQWDGVPGFGHAGEVSGVFPEQPYAVADPVTGAVSGQNFPIFGTLNLQGDDLADGTLDDHLVLFRSYTGSGTPGAPHIYQVNVKVRNAEGDYWDWGAYAPLVMTTNQDVTIDIQRAKPVIENLVDVSYNEDSGGHTITLVDKGSDIQSAASTLNWFVTDHPGNTHSYPTPYTYTMQGTAGIGGGTQGASLDINTLADQFGGHRLVLTVMDEHGLTAQQSIEVGIWNVNDAPEICNGDRFDCMPVLYDGGGGNTNVRDENFNGLITKSLGDAANASGSYIVDMMNEQTQSDWNNEAIPQTYTWAADEGTCVPFSTAVNQNVIEIAENTANEAGGNCDIVLSLDDGASENSAADAQESPFNHIVNFIVNPVNDAPVIKEFDAATNVYVETANGSLQLDWFWDVVEDDENPANLTFDLHRLMHDNDHYDRNDGSGSDELTWSVEPTSQCDYDHYFSITVDNDADTLALDLIPDAATNAPSSEIDFLQDADGDGVADNGIHQIQPGSGVYCTVYLWLNDTVSAPSHIDYAQHSSGTYTQRSVRETINIQVRNTPEARPDYHFDEVKGYDWLNIKAVLPGTRVPIEIDITNDGDDPALYNYAHDVQVRFYTDDNPTLIQDQVTIDWDDAPAVGETMTIRGYVTLTNPTESVRTFIEVRTINPLTGDYINDVQRRPALEELNWDNNNLTTVDTNDGLPQMVRLRGAVNSVTGFAPGLLAVGLVGAFVGALLMQSRKEEDAEEFEALAGDEEAVSPVIATILLVAITVVLSGVIYVWAQSLAADSTGKASTPRMSFDQEAKFDHTNIESDWYWKINVIDGEELASQAILVKVQWLNASGVDTTYQTTLANSSGVYGFVPSNSPNLVTYKDSIDCDVDCSAGFGTNDFIQVRMTDPFDGNAPIQDAVVTMYYSPSGGSSYTLMTWAASFNPPSISPQF